MKMKNSETFHFKEHCNVGGEIHLYDSDFKRKVWKQYCLKALDTALKAQELKPTAA